MQSNINHSLYECCMVSSFFFFAFCWQPFFIEVAFLKTQDNNQVPPLRFLPLKLETFLFFNNNNSSSQSTFWGIMMTLCDFSMLWHIISVLIFWSSDTILSSGIWSILEYYWLYYLWLNHRYIFRGPLDWISQNSTF